MAGLDLADVTALIARPAVIIKPIGINAGIS